MRCLNIIALWLFVLLALTAVGNAVDCICSFTYDPVCGSDGLTYSNTCILGCESKERPIKLAYIGEC